MKDSHENIEEIKQQIFEEHAMLEQAGVVKGAKPNRSQRRAIAKQAKRIINAKKR